MSTLRVLLPAALSATHKYAWAVYDAQDRLVRSGAGTRADWPTAQSREAVLAASAVRLARLTLPPMPADRVPSAAAYALEDQLAGPAQEQHIVASPQRKDGSVEVAIAARALFASLGNGFARVVAEPALAPLPPPRTWRWYGSGAGGSFVRKPDGAAYAVSGPLADAPAPAEIMLAIAQAARERTLDRIEVAFPATDAQLRAWSEQCAASFVRTGVWHWDQDGVALASATDLLQGAFSREPQKASISAGRRFRWAAGIAFAALALHVGATIVQWASLRYQDWNVSRSIVATARAAGAPQTDDAQVAIAALGKRFADARHRTALAAPADPVPLLARAAPALAALPPGALKTATYASGTWTFDVGKLDPTLASRLDRNLALAGLVTLTATTPAGTRVRVTQAAGTELP